MTRTKAKDFHTLFQSGTTTGLTDAQLLKRFAARHEDEAAFTALVQRHAGMVLRVCLRILGNSHDAQDAAQAVFLVLARKAGSIRQSDSIGGWLHGVTVRIARKARLAAARRRTHESRGARAASFEETWDDAAALLHEELDRLPEKYRAPILLCHFEGLTNEQAAQRLCWPLGTVQTRLARGRERLRNQLTRRGIAPSAPLAMSAAVESAPTGWAEAMADAAWKVISPSTARVEVVSASAIDLAEGACRAMMIPKLKIAATMLLAAGVGVGIGAAKLATPETEPTPAPASTPQEKAKPQPKPKAEEPRELKHDDGKSAGMKSIAGGGHAVQFESPGEGWTLTSVRLYGSRYGYPQAPDEDFKIYLCDEKFQKLATFAFPYATFQRGNPKWVTMDVKPTIVPGKFIVCADFDPAATKGVYVHHDAQPSKPTTSFVGLPDDGEPRPFTGGDWLIRAKLAPPAEKALPKLQR